MFEFAIICAAAIAAGIFVLFFKIIEAVFKIKNTLLEIEKTNKEILDKISNK